MFRLTICVVGLCTFLSTTNAASIHSGPTAVETIGRAGGERQDGDRIARRPMLLVLTQGASLAAGGHEVCPWEAALASISAGNDKPTGNDKSAEHATSFRERLAAAGCRVQVMYVTWPSLGGNSVPAERIAARIGDYLESCDRPCDVVLIGHSRGAILNHEAAIRLGRPARLGRLLNVMLDPTAALPMGDAYPIEAPANVDRTVVYDDGIAFLPGRLVTDGLPIAGAHCVTFDVAARGFGDAGTHGGIARWYAAEGFQAELEWLVGVAPMTAESVDQTPTEEVFVTDAIAAVSGGYRPLFGQLAESDR